VQKTIKTKCVSICARRWRLLIWNYWIIKSCKRKYTRT